MTQAGKDSPETTQWFLKPSRKSILLTIPRQCFFCGSFFIYVSCYRVFLTVNCSLVVTCWKRADLLALLYVMFYCVFVTFPYDVLGQMWCFIVLIPYLSYFVQSRCPAKVQSKWE